MSFLIPAGGEKVGPTPTFYQGDTRAIRERVHVDGGDTISSATISIKKASDDSAVITNAVCTVYPGSTANDLHDITYLWAVGASQAAGDYYYRIKYVRGNGETLTIPGQLVVRATTSKRDRYLARIARWLRQGEQGVAQRSVTEQDALSALDAAVIAYSKIHPQRKESTANTTAGAWEFDLPSDWVDRYSYLERVEYPYDLTEQARWYYPAGGLAFVVDEVRDKWSFTDGMGNPVLTTEASKVIRLYYTLPHAVTDTADSLPWDTFESVTQYAAGVLLDTLATEAARMEDPNIGADVVVTRDRQLKYRQQAQAYKAEARAVWGVGQVHVA